MTAASSVGPQQFVRYTRFRWLILANATVNYAAFSAVLMAYAPILGVLAAEFHVTVGEASLFAMATLTLAAAIGTLLSGVLVDRFGAVPCLIGGAALMVMATLLTPLCGYRLAGIALMRVLAGIGGGPISACTSSVAARWFPPHERGIFTGAQGAGYGIGIAIGFVAVPMALQRTADWRLAITWIVVIPAIGLVLSLASLFGKEPALPYSTAPTAKQLGARSDFGMALGRPVFYVAVFLLFAAMWLSNAFNSLTPAYIAVPPPLGLGLGAVVAGKYMVAVQLGLILGPIAGGILMERSFHGSARPVVMIAFLLTGLFMGAIKFPIVHATAWAIPGELFLAGFFLGFIIPVVSAAIAHRYPPQIVGKLFAIAFGVSVFGASVGVAVGGTLLHYTNSFTWPVLVLVLVSALGFVLSALFVAKDSKDAQPCPQRT